MHSRVKLQLFYYLYRSPNTKQSNQTFSVCLAWQQETAASAKFPAHPPKERDRQSCTSKIYNYTLKSRQNIRCVRETLSFMVLVLVQRAVALCKRTSQSMHVEPPAATTLNGEVTRSVAGRHAIGTGLQNPRAARLLVGAIPLAIRRALAPRRGLASAVT